MSEEGKCMASAFSVVDLTQGQSPLQATQHGRIDLDDLRGQLEEIRDALTPVVAHQAQDERLRLQSLELSLTVGLEGKVWFIAKGKGEASIKLVWGRSESATEGSGASA